MIKDYNIAAVISRKGLTSHQLGELKQTLDETSKLVEGVTLWVPGFCKVQPADSIDQSISAIVKKMDDVRLVVGEFTCDPNPVEVWDWIQWCDAILGMPNKMGLRLKPHRVWSLYRLMEERKSKPMMRIIGPWSSESNGTKSYLGKRH